MFTAAAEAPVYDQWACTLVKTAPLSIYSGSYSCITQLPTTLIHGYLLTYMTVVFPRVDV